MTWNTSAVAGSRSRKYSSRNVNNSKVRLCYMFFYVSGIENRFTVVPFSFSLVSSDLNSFYNLTKSSIENIGVNINFDPDVRIITPP